MTIPDLIHETFFAISSNKVRSGLTILGIVIGIGSVIAMIAIGQGAQSSIESRIQSIGSNLVMVRPGFQRGIGSHARSGRGSAQTLTQADAEAIEKEIGLEGSVSPEISKRSQVVTKGKNTNTQVIGTVTAYPFVRDIEMAQGSFISDQHVRSLSKVAVLGPTTRDDLFGEDGNAIGQVIRIKGVRFRIIGVTKSKGTTGFMNRDDLIFVPLSTSQRYLSGDDFVSYINIRAKDSATMPVLQQQVTNILLQRHNIADPEQADFSIMTQADIVETASSITKTFTILLASIAGISLLVGGIGIMNMMLTTVTERTREIGLRQALGAKKNEIRLQFLAEAVMITLIGGVLGVILGWVLATAINNFADISTQISLSSIILAFGVSAVIGIVFGYYPASRAAGLNPIDALRYE